MAGEFSDVAERLKRYEPVLSAWGKKTLRIASTVIGQQATENYMRDAKGQGRRAKVDRGPLRIQSGDLARSLRAGANAGSNPEAIERIEQLGATKFRLTKGSRVEYAAIHEYGGTVNPSVTDRMRSFAWAKYGETGMDVFKGIALTQKSQLDVFIPARPYLRPAATDAGPIVEKRALAELEKALESLLDG